MSSNCFVQKSNLYFPKAEDLAFAELIGGRKPSFKKRTGKEQVVFLHINEERSTYGVVQPSKKK